MFVALKGSTLQRFDAPKRLDRPPAAIGARPGVHHELRAAPRTVRLAGRFGRFGRRDQLVRFEAGRLSELLDRFLLGRAKPMLDCNRTGIVRRARRQERVTQVQQHLSGKARECFRPAQDLRHGHRVKGLEEVTEKRSGARMAVGGASSIVKNGLNRSSSAPGYSA